MPMAMMKQWARHSKVKSAMGAPFLSKGRLLLLIRTHTVINQLCRHRGPAVEAAILPPPRAGSHTAQSTIVNSSKVPHNRGSEPGVSGSTTDLSVPPSLPVDDALSWLGRAGWIHSWASESVEASRLSGCDGSEFLVGSGECRGVSEPGASELLSVGTATAVGWPGCGGRGGCI